MGFWGLSTKNDELLILIYEANDLNKLSEALLTKRLQLDGTHRSKTVQVSIDYEIVNSRILFILIEQDSETPIEQIEPIVRIQYPKIMEAFQANDYTELEKYLGDEDLLGIKIISKWDVNNQAKFKMSGIHKLDRYEYLVNIKQTSR